MLYPFMTLNDNTEIVHSEAIEKDGREQEPVHVHVCEGVPSPTATKIWITRNGGCLLCHNKSKIPSRQLRTIMQTIEARKKDILDLWYETFGQISYYC